MDYKNKLKNIKKVALAGMVSPGGLFNPVGKSASVVNKTLSSETAKTLLKNKLGMEAVRAKAKGLGYKAIAKKAATKTVAKTSIGALGLVAGAAALGISKIRKASKEVDKAVSQANKASQQTVNASLQLGKELRKRKAETGMSLSERRSANQKRAKAQREAAGRAEARASLRKLESLNTVFRNK
ncbi:MAG: hypothetical protein H6743_03755 [Rickettsiaceae bacterium]|nr:hypothetical protein [Rickettsiaceae bacterium]